MLVEIRTYTLRPGTTRDYLALLMEQGLPLLRTHLGQPLACYTSEVGELNQVIFLWPYADAADRSQRRGRLLADQAFLAYFQQIQPLIVQQHNALVTSVPLGTPPLDA